MAVVKKKLICRQCLAMNLYAVGAQQIFVEAIQEGTAFGTICWGCGTSPCPGHDPSMTHHC